MERMELKGDCERCFGLCCAALPFAASVDFAMDKNAGQPCGNLKEDFRCGIHAGLRDNGFRGCTVYDCFGAGQHISQVTYGGLSWREVPSSTGLMFESFLVMRQLHELLWYLTEALERPVTHVFRDELREAFEETEQLTRQNAELLLQLDVAAHRAKVNALLLRTSELVREEAIRQITSPKERRKTYERGADLIGAKLQGADLRGANLRGAYLIAADLRKADLRSADLIGADFRDADIGGADLSDSLFLTQTQVNAAKGNGETKLPSWLARPAHWAG